MPDREKVIKAFEICDSNEDGIVCKNCPYKEDKWNGAWEDETGKTCFQTLHADVLALLKEQEKPNGKCVNECECFDSAYERGKQDTLKEQEAVKPVRDKLTGRIWLCGNCGTYVGFEDNDPHDPNEFDKYCRECGRPVLWEGR